VLTWQRKTTVKCDVRIILNEDGVKRIMSLTTKLSERIRETAAKEGNGVRLWLRL
jgi:hypothetical protein